jgi:hypothetical protein
VDPYAVLGVAPGADERELLAAYRELAKQWHPDRGGGERAERRMAEINAAYDLLRAAGLPERAVGRFAPGMSAASAPPPFAERTGARGGWLSAEVRRALGPELLVALADREPVPLVVPVSTWASPRAILAVTDRRLLWLLDDVPVGRVRWLGFRDVVAVEHQVRRPRRRTATLTVRALSGRRFAFTGLNPQTASAIEAQVRAASPHVAPAAGGGRPAAD